MKVPDDKRFYVYPGYVLGWTPFVNNSGDIAYYSVSTNEDSVYPTFEYDDIFDTHVGGIYHHKHPTAKVFNNFHLLRAHVVSPTRYMKKMTLAIAPGQVTEFDVEVESPTLSPTVQTAKCKVDLQAMFISFELSVTSATPTVTPHTFRSRRSVIPVDRVVNVKKNAELTFTTSNPNTDYNVFFEYSWGDGTANHTMSGAGNVKKTYNKTGIYSVTIRGFNLISEVYENVTVYVYDDIKDNKFLRPIDPEPTGNISSATFMLIGDGNCTATYQLGDNSTARTLNVTLTDHFIAELEYVYATEGDYLIEIICSNPIDSKYINDYASVEDIITDLTLLPFPVAATNVTHHFELDVHPGTNTTCVWRWNDTTPSNASIVNQRTMSHMYTTYGNRTICIYCFNKISNQEICQFIEVQDIIQGLNFSIPVEPKAFKDTVSERKESQIIFYIEKGTGVTFQVNFDLRSTSASFKSDLIHNLDHRPNNKFLAYGTRKYAVVDYYPVSVYAENAVSNATIYGEAAVEREMTSADLILTQLDASLHRSQPLKEYFEVNETVHFEYKPNDGNSLLCFYNFSDKYEEPILTNKFKMNKSWPYSKPVTHEPPFPVPVEPFKVNITCWNNVSVVTKTKEVSVQKPVQNITGLVIKGGPENTTEKMDLCMKIDTGDDFNCTWTTSCRDCTDCTLFNTYKEYKNLRKDDGYACVAKCQFPTSGWYDVNVNCSNRLYWDTAKITVGSYSPVSGDYEVEAAYDEDCGTQNKAGSKGIKEGEEQASFAEGCKVKFSILGQSGYNTTYNYIFEPEEGGISTRRRRSAPSSGQSSKCSPPKCLFLQNFTVYSYKPSKEGKTEKTVTVNASNAVSWVVKTTKFYVIQRINNVSIENDGPAKEGQLVNFTFKAVSFGYKSCCLFDMGDPLSENRQFWIGTRETCEQNQQISEGIIKAKPDILKQNPTTGHHFAKYSHTFSWASIFIIRVECWNEVSREKYDSESNPEIAPVKILDKPCKIPELKYLNLEVKTSNPPTGIYKSDKYTVRTQIKLNCEKTNRVVYKWTLTNRTADGKDQVIDLIKTTENDTVFNIPKRRLDYGEYTLRCNASMYKVKGIWMEVVGFAKIRPSELWGEFQGGSGRADGQNKIIDIDSKPSHDPDDPDTQDGMYS